MQLQSQIMRENTRVLTDVLDVTSDASFHASHKHTQKDSAKGCQQARKEHIQRSSRQRTNVQHPAKQEPSSRNTIRR